MYSEQRFSNQATQTPNTHDSTENPTLERENYLEEKVTFEPTPFDGLLMVTIEYDDGDIQPDPLAADESVVSDLDRDANHNGRFSITHPLYRSENVKELPPYLPVVNSDSTCYPHLRNLLSKPKKLKTVEETGIKKTHKTVVNQSSVVGSVPVQHGPKQVTLTSGDSSDILIAELGEQMCRMIEDSRRIASELKRKKDAESFLARSLVRQIMKPGSQQVHNPPSSVANTAPAGSRQTLQQQKTISQQRIPSLSRQLLQKLYNGCSLEQAIRELKVMVQPTNAVTVKNRATVGGESSALELAVREPMVRPRNARNPVATALGKSPQGGSEVPEPVGSQRAPPKRVDMPSSSSTEYFLISTLQNPALTNESSEDIGKLQPTLPSFDTIKRYKKASDHIVEDSGDQAIPATSSFQRSPPPYSTGASMAISGQHPVNYAVLPHRSSAATCSSRSAVHPAHLLAPTNLFSAPVGVGVEEVFPNVPERPHCSRMNRGVALPDMPPHSSRYIPRLDFRMTGFDPGNVPQRIVDVQHQASIPVDRWDWCWLDPSNTDSTEN